MKNRMMKLMIMGIVAVTLAGCGAKTNASVEDNTAALQAELERLTAENEELKKNDTKAQEETIYFEEETEHEVVKTADSEVIEDELIDTAEIDTEATVEPESTSSISKAELDDMFTNYSDRIDKTKSGYGVGISQYKFIDVDKDGYPELFLLGDGCVVSFLTYANNDAWDCWNASQRSIDWPTDVTEAYIDTTSGTIKTYKNVANRYDEYQVYNFTNNGKEAKLKGTMFSTTFNDSYSIGTDRQNCQSTTRAEYDKYLEKMGDSYDICLTGSVGDGYFSLDEAYEEYLTEAGIQ